MNEQPVDRPWEIGEGGVSNDCPTRTRNVYNRCQCGACAICGYPLHSAVHMHPHGGQPGDKPFNHRFVPRGAR